ncbi:amine sulfotransferase-like [Anomaloglossus baeobatrachus]
MARPKANVLYVSKYLVPKQSKDRPQRRCYMIGGMYNVRVVCQKQMSLSRNAIKSFFMELLCLGGDNKKIVEMAPTDQDALDEDMMSISFKYKGIYFTKKYTSPEYIDAVEHMEIRDNDVFLVTYPKSGTVWTQQILTLIMNEGHRNGTEQINNMERAPWIENNFHNVDFKSRPSPRLFTSHLPYYLMPKDLRFRMGKVVYVCRNPKDALVSYYHFLRMRPGIKCPENWEKFLDLSISGKVVCGSWFDHVRGWYTHKEDFNILIVKYEEIKKDLRATVRKICKFLDISLDDEAIDIVVEKATFKNMKHDSLANYTFLPNELLDKNKGAFLRKGIVGDWKNLMTVAQSEMFDKVYKEKMGDLPMKITWELNEETAS